MVIYRFENAKGEGPYSAGARGTDACHGQCHPTPRLDGLADVAGFSAWHYGFASEQQARDWFGHVWDDLHNEGFTLARYGAPARVVKRGRKQVAFIRKASMRITKCSPS